MIISLEHLRALDGINCPKPEGAFYLFPQVSAYFDRAAPSGHQINDSNDLGLYLLEEHHVALVPGVAFGDPNGIRFSYAASMTDLERAMERIETGLADLN